MTSKMMKNIQQGGAGPQGQQQLVKAKDRGIDPADTSALRPGSASGKASDFASDSGSEPDRVEAANSASEKDGSDTGNIAGENTSVNASNSVGEPARVQAADSASVSASENAGVKTGRRLGRPKGPERAKLSVRILKENDAKLTRAVELTGENPQDLVDQALRLLFAKLKIKDDKASKDAGENASS